MVRYTYALSLAPFVAEGRSRPSPPSRPSEVGPARLELGLTQMRQSYLPADPTAVSAIRRSRALSGTGSGWTRCLCGAG